MSDALVPLEIVVRTPLDGDAIAANIAAATGLGLPEFLPDSRATLNIIANGPSAAEAPFGAFDGPTLALNGALSLFVDRGLAPTYWAACDPQPLVSNFVKSPPRDTTYLLASKCHPDVFSALKDRDIRLWHLDDHYHGPKEAISSAVSITLVAMSLMARAGWRRFEIWGWDGCYVDGADHAVGQAHTHENDATAEVGDRIFRTTGTWGAEAEDADRQLPIFDWMGIEVNIHGDGLFRAIRDWRRPKLFPNRG